MTRALWIAMPMAALALSGCLAKTALGVVTAPVKITGRAVDIATTSQSEADEKRGREIREREGRLGKARRVYDRQMAACNAGDERACDEARRTYDEIEDLRS